ncbi:MAG: type II secretion system protein [Candidatus Omnitrophica bacterium]|nr:type II secretion system protein [Candidatus Omnitrophota bacterium]
MKVKISSQSAFFFPKVIAQRLGSRSGFTLVEVMVSVGILGFILSAMLLLFINGIALNAVSRNLTVALSHTQYVLEDIRNAAFSNVPALIDSSSWNWDTTTANARVSNALKNELINVSCLDSGGVQIACATSSIPLTVMVTVSWTESAGRPRSVEITTKMGGS